MSLPTTVRRFGTAISGGLLVALALALPATAQAWNSNHWYNPNRNIECKYFPSNQSVPFIACTTFNNHRVAWIDGTPAPSGTSWNPTPYGFKRYGPGPILSYGYGYRSGAGLRCHSYTNAMQCWNTTSGHGFDINAYGITRF